MASKLDNINAAMMVIGSKTLTSLTTTTKAQRLANKIYDMMREEVLDMQVDWRFCTARAELSELDDNPAFGSYERQFKFPANCRRIIKMVDIGGDELQYDFRREVYVDSAGTQTDVILTNEERVFVKYIVLRTDESKYPAWFNNVIYMRAARMLFQPVREDTTLFRKIQFMYDEAWNNALAGNAAEEARTEGTGMELDKGNTDVVNAATLTGLRSGNHRRVIR